MSSGWVTCGNKSGERGENALSLYDCAAGGFGRLRAASGGGGGRGSNVNYVEKRGGRVPPPPSSYSPKQVDIAAAAGAAAEEEGEGGLLVQVLPPSLRRPFPEFESSGVVRRSFSASAARKTDGEFFPQSFADDRHGRT